jgi:glutamate synthase (NADPH/NADH) small chain
MALSTRPLPGPLDELHPPLCAADARLEADRCLECGGLNAPAPCVAACPAQIDVPAFVGAIARGDDDEAARVVFAENLLAGTCARVCPVEILCEGACVLRAEGGPAVPIAALQRHAAEHGLAAPGGLRGRPAAPTGRRVVVIGAGPAGLVAAGELALLGHEVVVYDEREEPGGLVRYAIAPFRQLAEPLPAEAARVRDLGVTLRLGERIDSRERLEAACDGADAVLLAIGMGEDADVRYPGEELEGVYESLPFIEALKTGRPLPVGERVVVIGGGNTAIDCAREARRLGADVVTLAYRRSDAEMPAFPHEVAEARAEGVDMLWLTNPLRFVGDGRLTGVECVGMRLGEPDASGRRRPEPVPGTEHVVAADTAVKAIGQRPRADVLAWIDGVELAGERIDADLDTGATGNARFFAAGDAVSGGSIVVDAVAQAKRAARAIDARLEALP